VGEARVLSNVDTLTRVCPLTQVVVVVLVVLVVSSHSRNFRESEEILGASENWAEIRGELGGHSPAPPIPPSVPRAQVRRLVRQGMTPA